MPKGNNKSSGSFQLHFNNERAYSAFGREYAKCYANMSVRGEFDKPVSTEPMTYEVTFKADCGCDTVLKNFSIGYQKTFKNATQAEIALTPLLFTGPENHVQTLCQQLTDNADDYTATLLTCAMPTNSTQQVRRSGQECQGSLDNPDLDEASTQLNLTAVDSNLLYMDPTIGHDVQTAVANVTLFGNAAARASLAQQGYNLTDPTIYQSWTWYGELINQLTQLGFSVSGMTGTTVNQKTYSGEINIGEIMDAVVAVYLGTEALAEFNALGAFLATDPDNTKVSNFMTFWWNASSYTTGNSGYATAPIEMVDGMPVVTLVFFQYEVSFSDWRSLFVAFHSENFTLYSTAIKLSLDMDIYNKIAHALIKKLGSGIVNHIKHTSINLPPTHSA